MSVSAESDPHGTARFEHEYRFQQAARVKRQALYDHRRASMSSLTFTKLSSIRHVLYLPASRRFPEVPQMNDDSLFVLVSLLYFFCFWLRVLD